MASVLKVDKLDPQSGTALELGTSGDTVSLPSGATLDISASTLTPPATMPASSGINFTALNATNLGSGTVPTARLGTGTASSSTVLYGDQTYKAEPGGGKILQAVNTSTASTVTVSASIVWTDSGLTDDITPSATSSKVLVTISQFIYMYEADGSDLRIGFRLFRDSTALVDIDPTQANLSIVSQGLSGEGVNGLFINYTLLDSPATTSAVTYKTQYRSAVVGLTSWNAQGGGHESNITLMEVGA